MSYFVGITFDLKGADPNIYPKIQEELKRIDFSKFVDVKREVQRKLPNNTFAAKFNTEEFDNGPEVREFIALPTAFSKKWTFDLPMKRAASRRHVFETHVNWFALIFQLHRTKPVNHLAQEASIRQR